MKKLRIMNIIYLHGFNSSGNGDTAIKLKEIYGENCITPNYDYCNPDIAYQQINNLLITECFNKNEECVLVGTSLGGFWANYFAEKYNLKCVLANPSIAPSLSLKRYMGENKNFSNGKVVLFTETNLKQYEKYKMIDTSFVMKTILLGEKDDIVNHKKTALLMKEHKVVIDKNLGHRITNVEKLVSLIDEMIYSYTNEIILENSLLFEHVINLLPNDKKEKVEYVDEVWDLLNKTYEKIGGLAGNGFSSKQEMIEKIPFWKLVKHHGKIVALVMYKDKNGRKSVALATNGTFEGKKALAMIQKEEFEQNRTYSEISGPLLQFTKKEYKNNFIKYLIPYDQVSKVIGEPIYPILDDDPEVIKHPELKDYFYQREIGGHLKTKLMIGTPGNEI